MKKLFLLAMVAVGFVTANAENTLETVWETNSINVRGDKIRQAVGVNGKFYAINHSNGNFEIWGEDGLEKEVSTGSATAGTCITRDDAGNILVGVCTLGEAFKSTDKFVIFSPEGEILSTITNLDLKSYWGKRVDKFGRASGDFMSEEGGDFYFMGSGSRTLIKVHIANGQQDKAKTADWPIVSIVEGNTSAMPSGITTSCMVHAVGPNELALQSAAYRSDATNGNNVLHLTYDAANNTWVNDGYYTTWQYNGMCGFATFQIGVQKYVVYARSGSWNVDSFWVSRAVIKNTTAIDKDADEATAVIQHAPYLDSAYNAIYKTDFGYNNNYTVEVVGEQAYIYAYDSSMLIGCYLFTPDANDISGIESIKAVDAAPVYYNLQGVRVNNPENGIFIEVRGNAVKKVVK